MDSDITITKELAFDIVNNVYEQNRNYAFHVDNYLVKYLNNYYETQEQFMETLKGLTYSQLEMLLLKI